MTFLGAVRVRHKEEPCIVGIADSSTIDTKTSLMFHEDVKIETYRDTAVMYAGVLKHIERVMEPLRACEELQEHPVEILGEGIEALIKKRQEAPYFLVLEGIDCPQMIEVFEQRKQVRFELAHGNKTAVLHGKRRDYGLKGHAEMRRSLGHLPQTVGEGLLWVYHVAQCATADKYTDNNFQFVVASDNGVSAIYPPEVLLRTLNLEGYIEEMFGDESFKQKESSPRRQELQSGRQAYFREQFVNSYTLFKLILDMTYHRWIDLQQAQINFARTGSLKDRHATVMRRSAFENRLAALNTVGGLLQEADLMQIQVEGLRFISGEYDKSLQTSYS